jgi:hypothetical protein
MDYNFQLRAVHAPGGVVGRPDRYTDPPGLPMQNKTNMPDACSYQLGLNKLFLTQRNSRKCLTRSIGAE